MVSKYCTDFFKTNFLLKYNIQSKMHTNFKYTCHSFSELTCPCNQEIDRSRNSPLLFPKTFPCPKGNHYCDFSIID